MAQIDFYLFFTMGKMKNILNTLSACPAWQPGIRNSQLCIASKKLKNYLVIHFGVHEVRWLIKLREREHSRDFNYLYIIPIVACHRPPIYL